MSILRYSNNRRWFPGDISLALVGGVAFGAGLLMLLSPQLMDGPPLEWLYSVAPPRVWGAVWLLIGLVPLCAVTYPTVALREKAFLTTLPAGSLWTAGLMVPLFTEDSTSLWLPLSFCLITSLGYVSYALIPLDSIHYRGVLTRKTTQFVGHGVAAEKGVLLDTQSKQ